MHFHQLHFVLLDYCVSEKNYTEMPKRCKLVLPGKWIPLTFTKCSKSSGNKTLCSPVNQTHWGIKRRTGKSSLLQQQFKKQKFPLPCPHPQNCSTFVHLSRTQMLYKHLLPFSPFKKLHRAFFGLVYRTRHTNHLMCTATLVCAWNPIGGRGKMFWTVSVWGWGRGEKPGKKGRTMR